MRSLVLGIRLRFISQNLFPLQERHTRSQVWHLQLNRHLEVLVWSLLNLFSHKSSFQCRRNFLLLMSSCSISTPSGATKLWLFTLMVVLPVPDKPKIRAPLSVSCPWAFLTRYILLPACSQCRPVLRALCALPFSNQPSSILHSNLNQESW